MPNERITRYVDSQPATHGDRVDEIVAGAVHLEMMTPRLAWMRVGKDVFWLSIDRKKTFASRLQLVVRWSETQP